MKTAVEWLQDCLTEQCPNGSFVWNTKADLEALFNQAKKTENQQGYSEEEVLVLLHKRDKHNWDRSLWQTPKEWFEQFKNK